MRDQTGRYLPEDVYIGKRQASPATVTSAVASPRETGGWIGKAAGATSLTRTRNTECRRERERELNGVPGEDPSHSEKYMYTKNAMEAKTENEISVIPRCARVGSRRRRERRNSGRVGTDDDYDDERLGIEFASYLPEEGVPTPSSGAFDLRERVHTFSALRQSVSPDSRWEIAGAAAIYYRCLQPLRVDILLRTIRGELG